MNISEVKTAKKIGKFNLRSNSNNKIDIEYLSSVQKSVLIDDSPRIYLIVSNGIIKKIGGSAQRGGIKGTMSFYVGAMGGSPGVPRFVIHLLIEQELKKDLDVELFMITSPPVMAEVSGLFKTHKRLVASFKEMEDICKADYYLKVGRYPEWNFQENHESYPVAFARLHNEFHNKRLKK
jgi:hypothetical protein